MVMSHLKISVSFKYVSAILMVINPFQNVFMYTHLYTFICIYTHSYDLYHKYAFCNAKEHFYKIFKNAIIVKMPLLFLTKTLQKRSFDLQNV